MQQGAKLVTQLIENAERVQAYDFTHLRNTDVPATKLTGAKMMKKTKPVGPRATYEFNL